MLATIFLIAALLMSSMFLRDKRIPLWSIKNSKIFTIQGSQRYVNEMEKMLNEYLQFASTGAKEKTENFNLSELINLTVIKYNNSNILFESKDEIYFDGRKNLIQRCINNLIDNSVKYGEKVNIKIEKIKKNIFVTIEDDGPGVAEEERENVFKPFYKVNKGRADSKSSVGLGLSISSDIIRSHGGNIELNKSNLGGLKVKISLPF